MTVSFEAEIARRGLGYHKTGHGWTCEPFGIDGTAWDSERDYGLDEKTKEYLAERFSTEELVSLRNQNPLNMPDAEASEKAEAFLNKLREEHNSAGGTIECVLTGLPAGLGDPGTAEIYTPHRRRSH